MNYIFVFSALVFFACQNLYAAGPACFNYEVYEHEVVGAAAPFPPNQALVNYDYATVHARNAVIPALAPGAYQIEVSLGQAAAPPALPVWQNIPINLGAALTLPESCMMALGRQNIGLKVSFQNLPLIAAVAAGGPVPPGGYVQRALTGGGYRTPLATTTYRLRNNIPAPNFLFMAPPVAAPANFVIVHIHNSVRVSKNLKELSHNSLYNPAMGAVPYVSVKSIIDDQFLMLGLAAPNSGTVVSSDCLQPD